ncbi:MAG: hypothetical protein PHI49_01590 [Halothiobacillaceae bacterium]|mgnify:CR=1 FL=1|jgi:hypothetical protein|nr:hypothetical protein [Halothiobacillaceae bacterium]MDY0049124.1 hypothetical protein [Halothiobacillaceae bacterium]
MENGGPLKVTLHGFDERARSMLALFLEGPAQGICRLANTPEEAEAAIVDLDGAVPERIWLEFRRKFNGPALVLSATERRLRNAHWVAKPVQLGEFKAAIERVRSQIDAIRTLKRLEEAPAPAAAEQPGSGINLGPLERRFIDIAGDMSDEIYLDISQRERLFYDPHQYIEHTLREGLTLARKDNAPVIFDGLGHNLIFCPTSHRIYTDMREQFLRSLCVQPHTGERIGFRTASSDTLPLIGSSDPRLQRLDSTLWNVSLWTSRGRVPKGTPLNAPIKLLAWPNLTRLTISPHALRIAALWATRPTSLMDTPRLLDVPYRHVFAFYSASLILGLVEPLGGNASPAQVSPSPPPLPSVQNEAQTQRRGLLSRLLAKLGLGLR